MDRSIRLLANKISPPVPERPDGVICRCVLHAYAYFMPPPRQGVRCTIHNLAQNALYEKLLPQPQLFFAFGFWKTKPRCISVSSQSTVMPFR